MRFCWRLKCADELESIFHIELIDVLVKISMISKPISDFNEKRMTYTILKWICPSGWWMTSMKRERLSYSFTHMIMSLSLIIIYRKLNSFNRSKDGKNALVIKRMSRLKPFDGFKRFFVYFSWFQYNGKGKKKEVEKILNNVLRIKWNDGVLFHSLINSVSENTSD